MRGLPWFRLYAEFATDPKVQMMSEVDQRRYLMLLCLRCSNGDVTLHDEHIAFQLRISEDEYTQTKRVLIDKKLIDERNMPTAWGKRQKPSDSSAARVSEYRNRKKKEMERECNVTVTPVTPLDIDIDIDKEKKEKKRRVFISPTKDEVNGYAVEKNLNLDGFFEYYESNGWMVGKNKMKKWRSAANGWANRQKDFGKPITNVATKDWHEDLGISRNAV